MNHNSIKDIKNINSYTIVEPIHTKDRNHCKIAVTFSITNLKIVQLKRWLKRKTGGV